MSIKSMFAPIDHLWKGDLKGATSAIAKATPWGAGASSVFKRVTEGGKKEDKASIAAGNADAAGTEADRQALESRRRGYLGLNNTGPRGVSGPRTSRRSTLGGY